MKMKPESKKSRLERRGGVLMEDLDSQLDLVLEGHEALGKKLDEHHVEFHEFVADTKINFEFVFDELRDIHKQINSERV